MLCKIYNYNNFDLSSLSGETMGVLVWGICIGVIIGTLISIFYKVYMSSFIKALVKNEIHTEETSKTVNDLDFIGKWYIKNELKYPYKSLRRYVLCANENEAEEKSKGRKKDFTKLSMEKARFYLPEENKINAELRFSEIKNPVGSFVITAAVMIAAAFFVLYAAPELLQMLDNFITIVKN